MNGPILAVGEVLKDDQSKKRYRIVFMHDTIVVLCELDIKQLHLQTCPTSAILDLINKKEINVEDPEETFIFDKEKLSSSIREEYERRLEMMNEVVRIYGPTFEGLTGKKHKPELQHIMEKYSCPTTTFWRICTRYFQSGMKEYSLVNKKAFGVNKGKQYQYHAKPGKKPEYFETKGITINSEQLKNFEKALNEYKSGRQKTLRSAYDWMNCMYYTRIELINGVQSLVLLPESERPTMRQFYYYAQKHITQQEKDIIKTSVQEHRNDKRLITSDALSGVYGPGDMVEIDACEADVSLVSIFDNNRTVGRPVVYFMIDVYTRIILAVSVAFDNNSILGITNLFLNLADDKKEYCARYGIGFNDDRLWPSNIIPRRIRVDRGSEFKSKEFSRICIELGIEKQLVPGASGSLKGIVEQSFRQMHLAQNVHLEDRGLIEKRYDSMHHKESTLDIHQYTKMVINFVLTHNQKYNENYPLTREMTEEGIKPIPAVLWQYGIQKYGSPRRVSVREQYIYSLMTPVKAKISRRGISYKGLWYFTEDDPELATEMFRTGTKKVTFEVRMDMRCIGSVYYLRNGKLVQAPLNPRLNGNADYSNLTMKQWDEYRSHKQEMDAQGRIYNEQLSAYSYAVNAGIVDEAKKETFSSDKDIRPARAEEKQAVSSQGRMQDYLDLDSNRKPSDRQTITENAKQEIVTEKTAQEAAEPDIMEDNSGKPVQPRKKYHSFKEAFRDF